MNSMKQLFVSIFVAQCFSIVVPKPIFKGLSFKKNYEMEISAIPLKHISFIKEKWFPFKMIGITHDIAKREVAEEPKEDNLYSVNEVTFDDELNGNFAPLHTSVNQDLNADGAIEKPVVENIQAVHVKPVIETENLATGIVHTSSVIPVNPSLIIAPSIHTGSVVQPAPVVPIAPVPVEENSAAKEVEVQPVVLKDETTPIQPLHTHIDVPSVEKLEESVSKMHTDISSVVPLNTLVETPVIETPNILEEIKEQPIPELPPVIVDQPAIVAPPISVLGSELETPVKSGPAGLIMRGTRFVLYFGSVMLQLLSQMISHSPVSLNQITEPLALK